MKVYVRVLSGLREYTKKRKVDESGEVPKIVMRRSKGKKAGWEFTLPQGSIINRKGLFGISMYVEVLPEASEAIVIKPDMKPEDIPKWDKNTSKKFIEAEMVKKTGEKVEEKGNAGIWVVAALVIANIVIMFLLLRGL